MGYSWARAEHEACQVEALVAGRFDWPEGLSWALGHGLYAVIALTPLYSGVDAPMGEAKYLDSLHGTREEAEAAVPGLDECCEAYYLVLPEAPPAQAPPSELPPLDPEDIPF